MEITILLDYNLDGHLVFLEAGLKETGWDQILSIKFHRLRDYGIPTDCPDDELWRFVQERQLLLLTHNRNNKGETSLQATIEREKQPDSLPVVTISDKDALSRGDYRRRVSENLAQIIVDLANYRGVSRVFVPF
ncbi:MAG: ACP S-malonyltransferase [Acidobacteriota bacterium]